MSEPKIARLWRFPEADFADYQSLVGGAPWEDESGGWCATFAEYEDRLTTAAEQLARQGYEVRLWLAGVQQMRACLRNANLANTPANRGAVIGSEGAEAFGCVLAFKMMPAALGWALINRPSIVGQQETPIVGGDFGAAIKAAIHQAEQQRNPP